jgi:hypothetical protein
MNIIRDLAATAQPTTTLHVEEHTIDTRAGQGLDLTANPDLLLNPTLTSRDVHTARDRDGGWKAFHALVANDPYRYRSGGGTRLVLVESDGGAA